MKTITSEHIQEVLHYADEFPHSGQNRELAEIVRHLLTPSAPLVAVGDIKNPMPKGWRLIKKTTCYALVDGDTCVANLVGPAAEQHASMIANVLAGQVAPQSFDKFEELNSGQVAQQATVLHGWKFEVSDIDDRTWLSIVTPQGTHAALSCAQNFANGETIPSQVLHCLRDALATAETQATVSLPISLRDMNLEQPAMSAPIGLWYQCGYSWGWKEAIRAIQKTNYVHVQATVEPLTGWRDAIEKVRDRLCNDSPSAYDNSGYRIYASAVLDAVCDELDELAATPPTSKATEEGPEFTIADGDLDWLMNLTADMLQGRGNMDMGLAWHDALETVLARLATSKADTGKATAKTLQELDALSEWMEQLPIPTPGCVVQMKRVAKIIASLKSATPSTIKEEPTGEQL